MYLVKIYGTLQLVTYLVHCYQLQLNGRMIGNNSYINYNDIGNGDGALDCLFERHPFNGHETWIDESGHTVQDSNGTSCLFMTRETNSISLNRKSNNCIPPKPGLWRCNFIDITFDKYNTYINTENLYIYIGNGSAIYG